MRGCDQLIKNAKTLHLIHTSVLGLLLLSALKKLYTYVPMDPI